MAGGKVSVSNGPEENLGERGDEAGASAGRGHGPRATQEAAYRAQSESNLGKRHGEEGREVDSGDPGPEIADAAGQVAEIEEILEGEIDERRIEEIIAHESWQGPLPPPGALAAYERVLKGAADRAFTMAERNLELRQSREQTVRIAVEGQVTVQTTIAEADRDALKRGQYLAAAISALIGILSFAGLWLTPWAAVGFTVPLAQVAAALVRTVSDRGNADISEELPDGDTGA